MAFNLHLRKSRDLYLKEGGKCSPLSRHNYATDSLDFERTSRTRAVRKVTLMMPPPLIAPPRGVRRVGGD